MKNLTVLLLLAAGCKTDKPDPDSGNEIVTDSVDTGDSGTTDTDTGIPCTVAVTEMTPLEGASEVYNRSALTVSFDSDASAAVLTVTDSAGTPATLNTAWSEGNVKATLTGVLAPDTDYTFTASICGVDSVSHFRTSHLGSPLLGDTSSLKDITWEFRLSDDATITEPSFLELMASTYVTTPLLIGVTESNDQIIDLLGALGDYSAQGAYTQSKVDVPWDFPPADFTQAPYFAATAPLVTLTYKGTPIPIEQFHLEGTITEDGAYIKEGKASGFLDTRNAGSWVGAGTEPGAVCDIAAKAGVTCVACQDGNPYCMYIVAEQITATQIPGLVLDPTLGL